ncbi:hypothetical protein CERSUDRAFT_114886 [Gelatoporia subvermispora B]|uniref:Phospholipase/carboxylesterase/thioesterase domain-containing protein n=1 Tax=Ceriporiopsis subvermispora (strain B) TaxID=914234 RepID=M2RDV9_CERS8|nr:hypothetical protein CERSUDRAFT_114886 [Gelatoporia subvermispora B]
MSNEMHLREPAQNSAPSTKPAPKQNKVPVPFVYHPSDDGTDENLLILLHGLGDSHEPFGNLGRSLKLPQTATLALRGPDLLPYHVPSDNAYQWFPTFDQLGEMLSDPNPSSALDLLDKVLAHLVDEFGWPPSRVHLFGFAQGGTVAAEYGMRWWRKELERQRQEESASDSEGKTTVTARPLASIVTVGGPLHSYPTFSPRCPTPILCWYRPDLPNPAQKMRKGYDHVQEVRIGKPGGMPRSREEWEPIMRFWSEHLSRRQMEGLYEIMSGTASA